MNFRRVLNHRGVIENGPLRAFLGLDNGYIRQQVISDDHLAVNIFMQENVVALGWLKFAAKLALIIKARPAFFEWQACLGIKSPVPLLEFEACAEHSKLECKLR